MTRPQVIDLLSTIPDPEIPVVNISEMGMLRDVIISEAGCEVILTPTYTGCPAMGQIEDDILTLLKREHIAPAKVTTVLDPAWTTDWMSDEAREKLRKYGIAPPVHSSCNHGCFTSNDIRCPHCNSIQTSMVSRFGSTACKSLYKCSSCLEPFEYFKCH